MTILEVARENGIDIPTLCYIQELPPKYRVPLVLHHYEGMAYKDIAAVMEISLSAVEARIHRAKKQLVKKLEPWLDRI